MVTSTNAESLDSKDHALGITPDKTGGHNRKGHEDAVRQKLGGGVYISEKDRKLAEKGYEVLPEMLKTGIYTKNELFHLSIEAAKNGVPEHADLGETLENIANMAGLEQKVLIKDAKEQLFGDPKGGLRSAIAAYQLGKIIDTIMQYAAAQGNGHKTEGLEYTQTVAPPVAAASN